MMLTEAQSKHLSKKCDLELNTLDNLSLEEIQMNRLRKPNNYKNCSNSNSSSIYKSNNINSSEATTEVSGSANRIDLKSSKKQVGDIILIDDDDDVGTENVSGLDENADRSMKTLSGVPNNDSALMPSPNRQKPKNTNEKPPSDGANNCKQSPKSVAVPGNRLKKKPHKQQNIVLEIISSDDDDEMSPPPPRRNLVPPRIHSPVAENVDKSNESPQKKSTENLPENVVTTANANSNSTTTTTTTTVASSIRKSEEQPCCHGEVSSTTTDNEMNFPSTSPASSLACSSTQIEVDSSCNLQAAREVRIGVFNYMRRPFYSINPDFLRDEYLSDLPHSDDEEIQYPYFNPYITFNASLSDKTKNPVKDLNFLRANRSLQEIANNYDQTDKEDEVNLNKSMGMETTSPVVTAEEDTLRKVTDNRTNWPSTSRDLSSEEDYLFDYSVCKDIDAAKRLEEAQSKSLEKVFESSSNMKKLPHENLQITGEVDQETALKTAAKPAKENSDFNKATSKKEKSSGDKIGDKNLSNENMLNFSKQITKNTGSSTKSSRLSGKINSENEKLQPTINSDGETVLKSDQPRNDVSEEMFATVTTATDKKSNISEEFRPPALESLKVQKTAETSGPSSSKPKNKNISGVGVLIQMSSKTEISPRKTTSGSNISDNELLTESFFVGDDFAAKFQAGQSKHELMLDDGKKSEDKNKSLADESLEKAAENVEKQDGLTLRKQDKLQDIEKTINVCQTKHDVKVVGFDSELSVTEKSKTTKTTLEESVGGKEKLELTKSASNSAEITEKSKLDLMASTVLQGIKGKLEKPIHNLVEKSKSIEVASEKMERSREKSQITEIIQNKSAKVDEKLLKLDTKLVRVTSPEKISENVASVNKSEKKLENIKSSHLCSKKQPELSSGSGKEIEEITESTESNKISIVQAVSVCRNENTVKKDQILDKSEIKSSKETLKVEEIRKNQPGKSEITNLKIDSKIPENSICSNSAKNPAKTIKKDEEISANKTKSPKQDLQTLKAIKITSNVSENQEIQQHPTKLTKENIPQVPLKLTEITTNVPLRAENKRLEQENESQGNTDTNKVPPSTNSTEIRDFKVKNLKMIKDTPKNSEIRENTDISGVKDDLNNKPPLNVAIRSLISNEKGSELCEAGPQITLESSIERNVKKSINGESVSKNEDSDPKKVENICISQELEKNTEVMSASPDRVANILEKSVIFDAEAAKSIEKVSKLEEGLAKISEKLVKPKENKESDARPIKVSLFDKTAQKMSETEEKTEKSILEISKISNASQEKDVIEPLNTTNLNSVPIVSETPTLQVTNLPLLITENEEKSSGASLLESNAESKSIPSTVTKSTPEILTIEIKEVSPTKLKFLPEISFNASIEPTVKPNTSGSQPNDKKKSLAHEDESTTTPEKDSESKETEENSLISPLNTEKDSKFEVTPTKPVSNDVSESNFSKFDEEASKVSEKSVKSSENAESVADFNSSSELNILSKTSDDDSQSGTKLESKSEVDLKSLEKNETELKLSDLPALEKQSKSKSRSKTPPQNDHITSVSKSDNIFGSTNSGTSTALSLDKESVSEPQISAESLAEATSSKATVPTEKELASCNLNLELELNAKLLSPTSVKALSTGDVNSKKSLTASSNKISEQKIVPLIPSFSTDKTVTNIDSLTSDEKLHKNVSKSTGSPSDNSLESIKMSTKTELSFHKTKAQKGAQIDGESNLAIACPTETKSALETSSKESLCAFDLLKAESNADTKIKRSSSTRSVNIESGPKSSWNTDSKSSDLLNPADEISSDSKLDSKKPSINAHLGSNLESKTSSDCKLDSSSPMVPASTEPVLKSSTRKESDSKSTAKIETNLQKGLSKIETDLQKTSPKPSTSNLLESKSDSKTIPADLIKPSPEKQSEIKSSSGKMFEPKPSLRKDSEPKLSRRGSESNSSPPEVKKLSANSESDSTKSASRKQSESKSSSKATSEVNCSDLSKTVCKKESKSSAKCESEVKSSTVDSPKQNNKKVSESRSSARRDSISKPTSLDASKSLVKNESTSSDSKTLARKESEAKISLKIESENKSASSESRKSSSRRESESKSTLLDSLKLTSCAKPLKVSADCRRSTLNDTDLKSVNKISSKEKSKLTTDTPFTSDSLKSPPNNKLESKRPTKEVFELKRSGSIDGDLKRSSSVESNASSSKLSSSKKLQEKIPVESVSKLSSSAKTESKSSKKSSPKSDAETKSASSKVERSEKIGKVQEVVLKSSKTSESVSKPSGKRTLDKSQDKSSDDKKISSKNNQKSSTVLKACDTIMEVTPKESVLTFDMFSGIPDIQVANRSKEPSKIKSSATSQEISFTKPREEPKKVLTCAQKKENNQKQILKSLAMGYAKEGTSASQISKEKVQPECSLFDKLKKDNLDVVPLSTRRGSEKSRSNSVERKVPKSRDQSKERLREKSDPKGEQQQQLEESKKSIEKRRNLGKNNKISTEKIVKETVGDTGSKKVNLSGKITKQEIGENNKRGKEENVIKSEVKDKKTGKLKEKSEKLETIDLTKGRGKSNKDKETAIERIKTKTIEESNRYDRSRSSSRSRDDKEVGKKKESLISVEKSDRDEDEGQILSNKNKSKKVRNNVQGCDIKVSTPAVKSVKSLTSRGLLTIETDVIPKTSSLKRLQIKIDDLLEVETSLSGRSSRLNRKSKSPSPVYIDKISSPKTNKPQRETLLVEQKIEEKDPLLCDEGSVNYLSESERVPISFLSQKLKKYRRCSLENVTGISKVFDIIVPRENETRNLTRTQKETAELWNNEGKQNRDSNGKTLNFIEFADSRELKQKIRNMPDKEKSDNSEISIQNSVTRKKPNNSKKVQKSPSPQLEIENDACIPKTPELKEISIESDNKNHNSTAAKGKRAVETEEPTPIEDSDDEYKRTPFKLRWKRRLSEGGYEETTDVELPKKKRRVCNQKTFIGGSSETEGDCDQQTDSLLSKIEDVLKDEKVVEGFAIIPEALQSGEGENVGMPEDSFPAGSVVVEDKAKKSFNAFDMLKSSNVLKSTTEPGLKKQTMAETGDGTPDVPIDNLAMLAIYAEQQERIENNRALQCTQSAKAMEPPPSTLQNADVFEENERVDATLGKSKRKSQVMRNIVAKSKPVTTTAGRITRSLSTSLETDKKIEIVANLSPVPTKSSLKSPNNNKMPAERKSVRFVVSDKIVSPREKREPFRASSPPPKFDDIKPVSQPKETTITINKSDFDSSSDSDDFGKLIIDEHPSDSSESIKTVPLKTARSRRKNHSPRRSLTETVSDLMIKATTKSKIVNSAKTKSQKLANVLQKLTRCDRLKDVKEVEIDFATSCVEMVDDVEKKDVEIPQESVEINTIKPQVIKENVTKIPDTDSGLIKSTEDKNLSEVSDDVLNPVSGEFFIKPIENLKVTAEHTENSQIIPKHLKVTVEQIEYTQKPTKVTIEPSQISIEPSQVTTEHSKVFTESPQITAKPQDADQLQITTTPSQIITTNLQITAKHSQVTSKHSPATAECNAKPLKEGSKAIPNEISIHKKAINKIVGKSQSNEELKDIAKDITVAVVSENLKDEEFKSDLLTSSKEEIIEKPKENQIESSLKTADDQPTKGSMPDSENLTFNEFQLNTPKTSSVSGKEIHRHEGKTSPKPDLSKPASQTHQIDDTTSNKVETVTSNSTSFSYNLEDISDSEIEFDEPAKTPDNHFISTANSMNILGEFVGIRPSTQPKDESNVRNLTTNLEPNSNEVTSTNDLKKSKELLEDRFQNTTLINKSVESSTTVERNIVELNKGASGSGNIKPKKSSTTTQSQDKSTKFNPMNSKLFQDLISNSGPSNVEKRETASRSPESSNTFSIADFNDRNFIEIVPPTSKKSSRNVEIIEIETKQNSSNFVPEIDSTQLDQSGTTEIVGPSDGENDSKTTTFLYEFSPSDVTSCGLPEFLLATDGQADEVEPENNPLAILSQDTEVINSIDLKSEEKQLESSEVVVEKTSKLQTAKRTRASKRSFEAMKTKKQLESCFVKIVKMKLPIVTAKNQTPPQISSEESLKSTIEEDAKDSKTRRKKLTKKTKKQSMGNTEDEDSEPEPKRPLRRKKEPPTVPWQREINLILKYASSLELAKINNCPLFQVFKSLERKPNVQTYFIVNKILVIFIYECLSAEDYSTVSCARTYIHLCTKTKKLQQKNIDEVSLNEIEQKYLLLKKKSPKFRGLDKIKLLDEFISQYHNAKKNLFTDTWINHNSYSIQQFLHKDLVETELISTLTETQPSDSIEDVQEEIVKEKVGEVSEAIKLEDEDKKSNKSADVVEDFVEVTPKVEEEEQVDPIVEPENQDPANSNQDESDLCIGTEVILSNTDSELTSTISSTMMQLNQLNQMSSLVSMSNVDPFSSSVYTSNDIYSTDNNTDNMPFKSSFSRNTNNKPGNWPDFFEDIIEGLDVEYDGMKKGDGMISGKQYKTPDSCLGSTNVFSPLIENHISNSPKVISATPTDQTVNMDTIFESTNSRNTAFTNNESNPTNDNFEQFFNPLEVSGQPEVVISSDGQLNFPAESANKTNFYLDYLGPEIDNLINSITLPIQSQPDTTFLGATPQPAVGLEPIVQPTVPITFNEISERDLTEASSSSQTPAIMDFDIQKKDVPEQIPKNSQHIDAPTSVRKSSPDSNSTFLKPSTPAIENPHNSKLRCRPMPSWKSKSPSKNKSSPKSSNLNSPPSTSSSKDHLNKDYQEITSSSNAISQSQRQLVNSTNASGNFHMPELDLPKPVVETNTCSVSSVSCDSGDLLLNSAIRNDTPSFDICTVDYSSEVEIETTPQNISHSVEGMQSNQSMQISQVRQSVETSPLGQSIQIPQLEQSVQIPKLEQSVQMSQFGQSFRTASVTKPSEPQTLSKPTIPMATKRKHSQDDSNDSSSAIPSKISAIPLTADDLFDKLKNEPAVDVPLPVSQYKTPNQKVTSTSTNTKPIVTKPNTININVNQIKIISSSSKPISLSMMPSSSVGSTSSTPFVSAEKLKVPSFNNTTDRINGSKNIIINSSRQVTFNTITQKVVSNNIKTNHPNSRTSTINTSNNRNSGVTNIIYTPSSHNTYIVSQTGSSNNNKNNKMQTLKQQGDKMFPSAVHKQQPQNHHHQNQRQRQQLSQSHSHHHPNQHRQLANNLNSTNKKHEPITYSARFGQAKPREFNKYQSPTVNDAWDYRDISNDDLLDSLKSQSRGHKKV